MHSEAIDYTEQELKSEVGMKLETLTVWCSLGFPKENLCFLILFLQALEISSWGLLMLIRK